tara:strand:+ start:1310 stop:1480 length:171 start_codon:yes stop_codon:yes gene_type:complete
MYTLAYIDPGTGSLIIQGIIAIFGAIVVYMGYPIRFIKKIFKSKKEKEKDINQKKL